MAPAKSGPELRVSHPMIAIWRAGGGALCPIFLALSVCPAAMADKLPVCTGDVCGPLDTDLDNAGFKVLLGTPQHKLEGRAVPKLPSGIKDKYDNQQKNFARRDGAMAAIHRDLLPAADYSRCSSLLQEKPAYRAKDVLPPTVTSLDEVSTVEEL